MAFFQLRKRYVYNDKTGKMEEISFAPRIHLYEIMPDLPDFVSPIDGKVVHGRRGLRDHNKRYGVTNISDYKGEWERFQNKRAEIVQGTQRTDKARIERAIRAYDDLRSGKVKPRYNPWNK
jgi:hypothetical protein